MRIVGKNYFTSFVSSAHNADVNDTACDRAIRVAGVHDSLVERISGPTLPTTTQPGETAAALSPTGAAAVSSRFFPNPESPIAKETLVMENKDNVLYSGQTAEENRKQLLKELAANIEQLCLALSMGSPNLVELQETKSRNVKQPFDTTWFQKVSGSTQPKTAKAGESTAAPIPSKSANVSSRFFPKYLASDHAPANNTTL